MMEGKMMPNGGFQPGQFLSTTKYTKHTKDETKGKLTLTT
jgi:hypothetical protein